MAKTVYFWEPGQLSIGRQNPKLGKIEFTNDAGQTKATKFEYDQHNNQTVSEEYDFAAPGSLGTLLRRTETAYEIRSGWINNNLKNLPTSVKTIVGGVTVSKTLIEYDHNGNDAASIVTRRNDIDTNTHSTFYNPAFPAHTETICPNDPPSFQTDGCITIYHPGYTAASAYRGNVSRVAQMLDVNATVPTNENSEKTDYKYDITGNLVEATLSCCQVKTIAYHKDHEYAFPVSETKGTEPAQLTSSATYNRNTGLVLTVIDENNQPITYEYETDTLRPKKVLFPNGGYTLTEYSDKLATTTSELVPSFVRQTATLENNKTAQTYGYFDGRGGKIRGAAQTPDGWSISAIEYDALGRGKKSYNPFYAATPTATVPDGTKYTDVQSTDALGRATQVRFPDNTTVTTEFGDANTTPANLNKTFMITTDQAGKKRRQLTDALGRIVRVDEPVDNPGDGNPLGTIDSPHQPTLYEYDGNDNLTKVIQSDGTATQERRFRYDSLSRLTHEKQVEATPTLDDNGSRQTNGSGLWTKVLKYNADGLLSDSTDARGVKTTFTYDTLNRMKTVVFTGETGYQTPSVTYTYDEARAGFFNKGALTRVETATVGDTPATATEFDYDLMKRIAKHRQSIGAQTYQMEYAYNLAGQLISEKYPSGRTVSINYDANGRLSGISDASRLYLNNLQYQQYGGVLSQFSFGNGTTQSTTLNDRLQMTNQTLSKGSEVLQKYDYDYGQLDANGNPDATKNNGQLVRIESHIGAQKQWTKKFSYDAIGRLKKEEEFRGDNAGALVYRNNFDFDRFGNLYRKQANNPNSLSADWIEESHISRTSNRLTTNTNYDDAGNVTKDTKFRHRDYTYDAHGRIIRTKLADNTGSEATSVYDAAGIRVAEKINDVWRFLIYDAFGKMVAEYGGLQSSDEGGVKYLLQDWQGSTRVIMNSAGFVLSRADYQAYGEEIAANVGQRTTAQGFGSFNNLRQKYGLTERDEPSGLDHAWFRKHENKAGRWTSPDPYNGSMSTGDPQSFNRYSYVENEPVNFVDPSGLVASVGILCIPILRSDNEGDFWYELYCMEILVGGGHGSPPGLFDVESAVNERLNSGDCRKKLNDLLKALGKGNLKDKKTGKTGFDALVAQFFGENKVQETGSGYSNYNPENGVITMNTDSTRGQGITTLNMVIGTEFIHEALHGATGQGSYFSHGAIVKAICKIEGVDYKALKKGQKALKGKGANDSSLFESPMNAWISKYCGEDRNSLWDNDYYNKYKKKK
jgi:RHS repeat-associated protein